MKWTHILYQKALARLNNDAELQGECSTVSQSLNDSWVTRRSKKRRPVSSSSDDELENKNRTPKRVRIHLTRIDEHQKDVKVELINSSKHESTESCLSEYESTDSWLSEHESTDSCLSEHESTDS